MTSAPEHELLTAARGDDGEAFGRLVAPYRAELHAHCHRMLGSDQDAGDALQHLPATQRAVLILREVLSFPAAEVAGILDRGRSPGAAGRRRPVHDAAPARLVRRPGRHGADNPDASAVHQEIGGWRTPCSSATRSAPGRAERPPPRPG